MIAALGLRASLLGIGLYQRWASPRLACRCRFRPTCSEYARQALITHGVARGWRLAWRRLSRCRPGQSWGYDPVPTPVSGVD